MSEEVIKNAVETKEIKNKREKPEDFIGWKSPDGKLEVIGIAGKQGTSVLFKVTCTECSKDHAVYPDGCFISTKGNLKKGRKPCGCSKAPRRKDWQYLIFARRAGEKRGFIVHGFAEEFNGVETKLDLECLKDGHKWVANINNTINGGKGCPKCGVSSIKEKQKTPEYIAIQKCTDICKDMKYDVVGFPNKYGNKDSRFEYICKIHGKQNVNYNNFVNKGSRCLGCARDKQKQLRNGNGYFPERKDEQDYLYILDFNGDFIKVGRSFDIERRISELNRESGIKNIIKLRTFTATHQEIYDCEQKLHEELRIRGFQYYVSWSTECFENESSPLLNQLLGACNLDECLTN